MTSKHLNICHLFGPQAIKQKSQLTFVLHLFKPETGLLSTPKTPTIIGEYILGLKIPECLVPISSSMGRQERMSLFLSVVKKMNDLNSNLKNDLNKNIGAARCTY